MAYINTLTFQLEHPFFTKQPISSFCNCIDNCKVQVSGYKCNLKITITGRKGEKKLQSLAFDILNLLFIILGGFPQIIEMSYNGEVIDLSKLAHKYTTDDYFKKSVLSIMPISDKIICQQTLDKYRSLKQAPIQSMQCLISDSYKHIITNHKITLLLHVIDGLVEENQINKYEQELKTRYKLAYTPKSGSYIVKAYYLCKGYFFEPHKKYNCEILFLLKINQYKFLQIITDTRHWYSHFPDNKTRKNRLTNGIEMLVYFEIIFYALRLYLTTEKLGLDINYNNVKEYYYVIHDWLLDIKKKKKPVKSNTYKIIEGFKEMERAFKLLEERYGS